MDLTQESERLYLPQVSIFFLVQNHLNTRQVCVGFEKSITGDGVLSRAGSNKQSTKIKRRNFIFNIIHNFMFSLEDDEKGKGR